MATSSTAFSFLLVAVLALLSFPIRQVAADPDPLVDFANFTWTAPNFVLRDLPANPTVANASGSWLQAATGQQFPALSGQGMSMLLATIVPCGVHTGHTHPRGGELAYVIQGQALIGFMDVREQMFENTLVAGDSIVIPRGMWHYIQNTGRQTLIVLSFFNTENPGALQATTGLALLPREVLKAHFGLPPNYPDSLIDFVFYRNLNNSAQNHLTLGYNCHNVGPPAR